MFFDNVLGHCFIFVLGQLLVNINMIFKIEKIWKNGKKTLKREREVGSKFKCSQIQHLNGQEWFKCPKGHGSNSHRNFKHSRQFEYLEIVWKKYIFVINR